MCRSCVREQRRVLALAAPNDMRTRALTRTCKHAHARAHTHHLALDTGCVCVCVCVCARARAFVGSCFPRSSFCCNITTKLIGMFSSSLTQCALKRSRRAPGWSEVSSGGLGCAARTAKRFFF